MLDLNALSESLLLTVKQQVAYESLVDKLANDKAINLKDLKTDKAKIAFWINIYNAFYQILAAGNPNTGKSIYKLKNINIGGRYLTLDDIEHGILRKGKHKYSLGYFNSALSSAKLKALQPQKLDYRIHFALNCGAKSCPPISFYSLTKLDEQLDMSTASFLKQETKIELVLKEVRVSKLFLWFRKDFGGRKGIDKILKEHLNFESRNFKLKYADYDWTDSLRNFTN